MTGAIPQVWSVGPLPTVADIRRGEILSGCTGVRDRPTCVKTLYTLVHVAFFRISEMVEDCMCGTIPESRTTFGANLDAQAVRIADLAPSGSPVPGTDHSAT